MSKIPIQTEVDFNTILNAAAKLKLSELEIIVKEFNLLLDNQRAKNKKQRIQKVTKLIHKSVISSEKLKRYNQLVDKLERRTMTDDENHEFQLLTEEDKQMQNQRIKLMIKLAHLSDVPFNQIREEFRFKSSIHV